MHRSAFLLLSVSAAIGPSSTFAFDGDAARLPRPRPQIEPAIETSAWASAAEVHFREASADSESNGESGVLLESAATAIEALAPLPRPRPQSDGAVLALVAPRPLENIPVPVEADDPACPARLKALGVIFSQEAPLDPGGECSVSRPLSVTALGSGVALEPDAILNCRAAESLALWVKETLVPAALERLGASPISVIHSSTYVCRPRNDVAGSKISEHAHANAVDIGAVRFAGRADVAIGQSEEGSVEASFEADIRAAACDHFTTVLGPGSDDAHATHLHFDLAIRRGGYRLCEPGEPIAVRAPENTKRE